MNPAQGPLAENPMAENARTENQGGENSNTGNSNTENPELLPTGAHPTFAPPRLAPAQAASAAIAAMAVPAGAAQVLTWDEMVPVNWDPLAGLGDLAAVAALPDSDARVQRLYAKMRAAWDRAPTVAALNAQKVEISGFVVPLEVEGGSGGGLREFLLVPYFGACIHTPAPPANQIIHVRLDAPAADIATMDAVTVTGPLAARTASTGDVASGYALRGVGIEKITPNQ